MLTSAFQIAPLPPMSASVSISHTPPSLKNADVLCGRPLTVFYLFPLGYTKGPSIKYVSIFEGGGVSEMLTLADMGGGGLFKMLTSANILHNYGNLQSINK